MIFNALTSNAYTLRLGTHAHIITIPFQTFSKRTIYDGHNEVLTAAGHAAGDGGCGGQTNGSQSAAMCVCMCVSVCVCVRSVCVDV